jgi:hypothetical protein
MNTTNKQRGKKVTKTIRIKIEDAFIIEQAARELAAELQQEIKVSDLLSELTKDVKNAKERIKNKITKIS